MGDRETGRQGDRETGRQGDRETGRQGDRETGRRITNSVSSPQDAQGSVSSPGLDTRICNLNLF